MKHLPVVHSQTMRIGPSHNVLDISGMSTKTPAFSSLALFVRRTFGAVRLYLTPEEEQKERFLFAGGLLSIFLVASLGIAVTNGVSFLQETRAQRAQVAALPGTLQQIVQSQQFEQFPELLTSVDALLADIDQHVAPGRSTLFHEGSLLHEVSVLRETGRSLMEAGREALPVLTSMAQLAKDVRLLPQEELRKKYGSLTTYLRLHWKTIMERVYPHLVTASDRLGTLHPERFAAEHHSMLTTYQQALKDATNLLERLDQHMPAILSMLGEDTPRTYAIILQSAGEMRATGGFIGSLALLKLNDGWVEYLRFRDVYDIDGQLFEDVPPPPGLEQITRFFRLRDSNYWPDFPTSARQIAWFLDKDKGPGVDGIFALTDTFIADLLTLTGPVGFSGSEIPVTADNFSQLMSFLVESKQNKAQPKTAVFAFSDVFVPQLLESVQRKPEALTLMAEAVSDRRLLAFAFDPAIQEFFEDAGLSGTMYMPHVASGSGQVVDYFLPAFTTTGGNKSDRYIEQSLTHESRITEGGEVHNAVTLFRRHTWSPEVEEGLRSMVRSATGEEISERVMEILGGERNQTYVRYFVPKGARLLAVEGVERNQVKVLEDLGRTVFGFRMETPKGGEARVKITYALPDRLTAGEVAYYLIMQKQPGGVNIPVTKQFVPTSKAVLMADSTGYTVTKDSTKSLQLDMRPQTFLLRNIWNGGYLLRLQ